MNERHRFVDGRRHKFVDMPVGIVRAGPPAWRRCDHLPDELAVCIATTTLRPCEVCGEATYASSSRCQIHCGARHLTDEEADTLSCGKRATVNIWEAADGAPPSVYVHACDEHRDVEAARFRKPVFEAIP